MPHRRCALLTGVLLLPASGAAYLCACTVSATSVNVTSDADSGTISEDSGVVVSDDSGSGEITDSGIDAADAMGSLGDGGGVGGLYFTSCLSQLSFGDVRKVLRFYTVTEFTPSDAGGTLNLTMTPLRGFDPNAGPIDGITGKPSGEFVAPDNFSLTFARGAAIPASGNVDNAGAFSALMGTVALLSEANPISGRPIKIESTLLKGRFASSTDTFCSTLSGQVVVPIQQPLTASDNICLFVPLKDGDPLPVQVKADFVCNVQ